MEVDRIKKISVIGTGMIGPDISLSCTMAGYSVTMVGRTVESIDRGHKRYRKNLNYLVNQQLYTEKEADAIHSRLSLGTNLVEGIDKSDFVFEAIIENLKTKQKLFKEIDKHCGEHTIMASSTSGLSPNDISAKMKAKDRMLVMHFWNPPYLVPLVEVVAGNHTSKNTIDTSLAFLSRIGKEPVLLKKDIPGHIGNRLQHSLFREAINLVEKGVASPEDIDRVILNSIGPRYSMIGPMEYMDSVGLDLQVAVQSYLFKTLADDKEPQKLLRENYNAGNYGAKTGLGFYDWTKKNLDEMTARQNKRFIDRLKNEKNK